MTTSLAVASALVAIVFAASTFERWLLRRTAQHLTWTAALVLFVVGAGALAWGSSVGWSPTAFRIFYAAGAVANVPVLAFGQLYLLLGPRRGDRVVRLGGPVLGLVVGVVLADPLRGVVPRDRLPKGDEVFHVWPRIFAAVGSGVGAIVLVVGSVLGVAKMLRSRGERPLDAYVKRRIAGLVLLAVGTVVLGMSGLLNSVLGEMEAFAVTLMLGVTILFFGFALSTTGPTRGPL